MQLVLHAGAHFTDEDRLLDCLIANREMLAEHGTQVPHPAQYRRLLRDILHTAFESGIAANTGEVLMDALDLETVPERLILSNAGFFGTPKMAAARGDFYTTAAPRTQMFQRIFDGAELELFFSICNPASFLPRALAQTDFDSLPEFLDGTDPTEMRWSAMIERLRTALPDMPITVWCNEDTPLIWGQILRKMAGAEPGLQLAGEFALLREIMTPAGVERFEAYLAEHPDMSGPEQHRVIVSFLEEFADEPAIVEEIELPGWTPELVNRLSDLYDEDTYRIARMPHITLISP